jgi:hypothetical protein
VSLTPKELRLLQALVAKASLTAAGVSSEELSRRASLQLRDRLGKWIFMGGLGRFLGLKKDGTSAAAIGELVDAVDPKNAVMRVKKAYNGIPAGDYVVPTRNISRASAVLPESLLDRLGIKPAPAKNLASLLPFEEMAQAAASRSGKLGKDALITRVQASNPAGDRIERDGWESVDVEEYLEGILEQIGDQTIESLLDSDMSTDHGKRIRALLDKYKDKYGDTWRKQYTQDFKESIAEILEDVREQYRTRVDLYRQGNTTIAVDRAFRDHPEKFDTIMSSFEDLRKNTGHGDSPIEIIVSANEYGDADEYGNTRDRFVLFRSQQDGKLVSAKQQSSMFINASYLLPGNEKRLTDFLNDDLAAVESGDDLYFSPAAYEDGIEGFFRYVAAHEWGHHLDFSRDYDNTKTLVDFNGEQMRSAALSSAVYNLIQNYPWMLNRLGEYANEDPYELFAELFAQVYMENHGDARLSNIPDALKKLIQSLTKS